MEWSRIWFKLGVRLHPAILPRNLISAACIRNLFSHYPEHMTIDEGQSVDRPGIRGLSLPQLSGTAPAFPQMLPQTARPSPTLPSCHGEQEPGTRELLPSRLSNPSFSSRKPSESFLQKASHEEQICATHFT